MGFFSKLSDFFSDEEKQYDVQGRLVKILQYYNTGALAEVINYNPETGHKVKSTEYKHSFFGVNSYKVRETVYFPNSSENIQFVIEFKNEVPIKEIVYNENGSIKEVKNF